MTAPAWPAHPAPLRARRVPWTLPGRLLRLELRRNAMLWLIPVIAALFWYSVYRPTEAMPPLWNLRAMSMQHSALLDFVPVAGAAAWMGSRDSRRRTADLVLVTARPRWARQLAVWAATTLWALAAYVVLTGAMYAVIAHQVSWGGPLWWPAAVGAAGIPAMSAAGFAAGVLFPSRFTVPLVTVAVFFGTGFSVGLAHGSRSYWQISPLISGSANVGTDPGIATFYHYLPDLAIAQVLFLAGLTAAVTGALGLPAGSGGRWLRGSAAICAVAGLAAAGTAVALAGTGRLAPYGMIAIPALHDAGSDQPIRYTPVCHAAAVPVCLNPAYRSYLPVVAAALQPALTEVAGLPGAPARISQAAPVFREARGNGITTSAVGLQGPVGPKGGDALSGSGHPSAGLILPDPFPGQSANGAVITTAEFAAQIRVFAGHSIIAGVIGSASPAQQAVQEALVSVTGARPSQLPGWQQPRQPGPRLSAAARAAAQRFAALPAVARHAWLVRHLAALRAGRVTLAQLP
jgi:hypothetical protein